PDNKKRSDRDTRIMWRKVVTSHPAAFLSRERRVKPRRRGGPKIHTKRQGQQGYKSQASPNGSNRTLRGSLIRSIILRRPETKLRPLLRNHRRIKLNSEPVALFPACLSLSEPSVLRQRLEAGNPRHMKRQ